MKKNYTESF